MTPPLKKRKYSSDQDQSSSSSDNTYSCNNGGHKPIRRINPLGFRVLVRLVRDSNMTDTGLYLPEGAKQNMQESLLAEVVEVASAVDDDTHEEANVSGIPHGALVLIPKDSGIKVPWDDELRIIDTKHVLAIVNEVSII